MGDIRDELIKAGLASEESARRSHSRRRGFVQRPDATRSLLARPDGPHGVTEPRSDDVHEIIRWGRARIPPGSHRFHYVDRGGHVLYLEVAEEVVDGLVRGSFAIVETPATGPTVIRSRAAEMLLSREPEAVRFWNRP